MMTAEAFRSVLCALQRAKHLMSAYGQLVEMLGDEMYLMEGYTSELHTFFVRLPMLLNC